MSCQSKLRRLLAFNLAVCGIFLAIPLTPATAAADLTYANVTFADGMVKLEGTVISPKTAGRHPAIVLVAGAGATGRWAYRAEAEAYARAGIVALVYDKRAGYSRASSNFADLAADATAGVELLRGRTDVIPSRVGLWGHSQGGWVVPLAASRSRSVAFVVTVSASALTVDRTQLWSNRTYLSHAGVAIGLVDPIGTKLSRTLIGAGLFGDVSYDPIAALAQVHQPVLAIFADHDQSTAPGESLPLFSQALNRAGNKHYTLRVIKDANHNQRFSESGFTNAHSDEFAPGFVSTMTGWVNDLAGGPPAVSIDPAPHQLLSSTGVHTPHWYESAGLQVGILIAMLVGFVSYPVIALIRRRTRPPLHWLPVFLAASGIVTIVGTAYYLFSIVQTGATGVDTVLLGRPPIWLLLQLSAVGTIVAAVTTTLVCARKRHSAWRYVPILAASALFLPWAAYWGLLTIG
jgi:dienelactone hydrolase